MRKLGCKRGPDWEEAIDGWLDTLGEFDVKQKAHRLKPWKGAALLTLGQEAVARQIIHEHPGHTLDDLVQTMRRKVPSKWENKNAGLKELLEKIGQRIFDNPARHSQED